MTNNKVKKKLAIATFIAVIGGWELLTFTSNVSSIIFPSASEVFLEIANNLDYLLYHSYITLVEALIGFILGFLIAAILAILYLYYPIVKSMIHPYVVALRSIPIIALAPLVILWIGFGIFSKIMLAGIISFFPILINFIDGVESIPSSIGELLKSLNSTKSYTYFKVYIPYVSNSVFAGFKVAASFAVIGAIVAEFVSSQEGIGYVIKSSTYYNNTSMTFAGIIFSAIIGVLFYELIHLLHKKIVFWEEL